MSITQVLALMTGIAYVVLAAMERPLCWGFGIISCALIAWDDFMHFQLYADGVLQLFYIGMGVVGLYQWRYGAPDRGALPIAELPWQRHLLWIVIILACSIPVSWLLRTYTDAAYGYADTATTLASLVATWLLVRKILSNWLYWIVIDAVYVFLFYDRGGALIALLYTIFMIVAMVGYAIWKRRYRAASIEKNSK